MKKKLVVLSILCVFTLSVSVKAYSATTDIAQNTKLIRLMRNTTPGGGMN